MILLVFLIVFLLVFLSRDRDILQSNEKRDDGITPFLLGTSWSLTAFMLVTFI